MSVATNKRKNYVFWGLSNLDLTRGLWMIYLSLNGFSLTELGILEGAFHLTSFLMEVPTGMVADLWGRKAGRLLGRVFFLLSLGVMFYSRSLWVQLIGFVLCAINYNLESGAGDALVYDSLKQLGREEEFRGAAAVNNLLFEAGSIVSYLLGGWLAVRFGYSWVFGLSAGFVVSAILIGLTFTEPELGREERTRLRSFGPIKAIREQARESALVVRRQGRIAFLILFTQLIFMFITSTYFYLQTYWKSEGWTEFTIGIVLAAAALISAVGGMYSARIEKRIGEAGVLIVSPCKTWPSAST